MTMYPGKQQNRALGTAATIVFVIVAFLAAGCVKQSGSQQRISKNPSKGTFTVPCSVQVAGLKRWLDTWIQKENTLDLDVDLVVRQQKLPGLPRSAMCVVSIARNGVYVGRHHVPGGETEQLRDELKALESRMARIALYNGDTKNDSLNKTGVVLVIDKTTPWSLVAATAMTISSTGVHKIGFAFEIPYDVRDPGPSLVDVRLRTPSKKRKEVIADLWQTKMDTVCPVMARVRQAVESAPPNLAKEMHVHGTLEAFAECQCRPNSSILRRLLFAQYYSGKTIGIVWRSVSEKGVAIPQRAETPWERSSGKVYQAPAKGAIALVASDS